MHEATLVGGILRIVREEVAKYTAQNLPSGPLRVKSITLELGLLACVEEETLRGCFEILAEQSVAAEAALVIVKKPLHCVCDSCGQAFCLHKKHFLCPACGSSDISFEGGHGCTLSALEVES